MVTSRIALEGLLQQNRLSTNVCKDTLRMQGSATDLFHLYAAGKRENDHHHHAVDETSSSSCGADTMTTAIKREAHTPTTDQSEDSGVDVSAAARGGGGDGHGGRPYKRRRPDDDDDDYDDDDGCRPTAAKSSRMADAAAAAAQAVLSVNVAACPPFRPWSSDESPSAADVGLRLFHDIRNVDRILTLTQRRREPTTPPPPPETQPLDLTNGRGRRDDADTATVGLADSTARTATVGPADSTARAATPPSPPSPPPPPPSTDTCATTAVCGVAAATNTTAATTTAAATRYSKNMSRARRIEANARERSRVHTISAAFDTLRATIPSYSRNQKLSKLSTIRIASAYILTLSRLLDMDYSAAQDRPSVDECVDNVTGIIHMEGKARKKKDER